MDIDSQRNNSLELKKHVNTIHCSNELSLLARKTFNALLFHAYHDLPNKSCFTISTNNLRQLIGFKSNDIKMLRTTLLTLVSTVIEWNVIGNSKNEYQDSWQASTVLAAARLENGVCTYEYSSIMRKQLYRPDMYGKLDMCTVSQFSSSYALALYENCIRYQGLGQTPWMPFSVFRKLMGVSENKYAEYKEFKKRVLNIAVNEVNVLTKIQVTPLFKKLGRKIEAIKFQISEKIECLPLNDNVNIDFDERLNECLQEKFNLSKELITELTTQYNIEYLKEKIALVLESRSYKSGSIESLSGYLLSAIKNNHQKNISSKAFLDNQRQESSDVELESQRIASKNKKEQQLYTDYQNEHIQNILNSLNEDEQQQILNIFMCDVIQKNPTYVGWYKKFGGIKGKAIKSLFNTFLLEQYPGKFGGLLSFEQFKTQGCA